MKPVWCLVVLVACAQTSGNNGIPPNCGDGVVQSDEECDDGNTASGDGCSAACTVESGHPRCGDNILETGEQCDDGNMISHDGCSATCQTESSDLPCTPHGYRCGPNDAVEVCNNAGTAWQFVNSCAAGCSGGVCTDPTCAAGATRCHGDSVETCNVAGDGWTMTATCSTFCASGTCALTGLTVGMNSNYDGAVIVAGDVVVTANSTLTASTGNLTIIADNIRVEAGAAIAVSPAGDNLRGASCVSGSYGYAANYGEPYRSRIWNAYGGELDADVESGSIGGHGGYYGCTTNATFTMLPTHGGGTLRLIAKHDVTIAGQLLAAGENAKSNDPFGGSGGGIQIASDTIEITGSISTAGGTSGTAVSGYGRVRLVYGNTLTLTGTIIGNVSRGRRPPIELTSSTHPNRALVYNDDFPKLTISHERPFASAQGYLHAINRTEYAPPQPASSTFSATESFDVPASALIAGNNYVHIASIDASSALGAVESRFPVVINSDPPLAQSTSHTSATTWYPNANPYFAWTNPQGLSDRNFRRVHYVLDHFGDTIPTASDTALAISQKQLLVSNLAAGIWVLHVLTEDTMGYLTKLASHVVVRIGADPGFGTVFGSVFDENQHPVAGAVVRVNRGLFQATTNSSGSYTINGVAAGQWEVSVKYVDHKAPAQTLTVIPGGQASANFSLMHL